MHSLENNEPNVAYVEVRQVPLITAEEFAGMGSSRTSESSRSPSDNPHNTRACCAAPPHPLPPSCPSQTHAIAPRLRQMIQIRSQMAEAQRAQNRHGKNKNSIKIMVGGGG